MPPDASPTTATVPPAKPPRRRPKAKRPAAPVPTTPRKPRATVLARVAAMGPTHVLAYRTLAEGHPEFADAVRNAFDANDEVNAATAALDRAHEAREAAAARFAAARDACVAGAATLAKLDRLARDIATARGDVPDDDATDPAVAPASAAD